MISREKLEPYNIPDYIQLLADHNDERNDMDDTTNNYYDGSSNWPMHPVGKLKLAKRIADQRQASIAKRSLLKAAHAVYKKTVVMVPDEHGNFKRRAYQSQTHESDA